MAGRQFIPDPPPFGTDPVLAEWLNRQLRRINLSTSQIVEYQVVGGGQLDGVRVDLDAHIQNEADPHNVQHAQLVDVAANLTHSQVDAELTRLEDEKVTKAGDTMTGSLIVDGTAGETDIVLKGDPIDIAAPVNGSALLLRDSADVGIGGIAAITTNPADPGNVAFFMGSLDKATSVIVDGAAAVIAPTNIAVGTPGAVLGSRMVCSGFTSTGLPILAWEDPPPAAYSPACANATDFLIHIGAGTSAWAEVCVITTTQQIEASQTLTVFWSMHLDNRSARTGNFEVTFTSNGAAPGSPVGAPVIVSNGMNENVSGSAVYPSGVVYPVGTTFEYHVRATGDHQQFELWAMGTINPAEMEIQVR